MDNSPRNSASWVSRWSTKLMTGSSRNWSNTALSAAFGVEYRCRACCDVTLDVEVPANTREDRGEIRALHRRLPL